jgi:hypothetical protein
MFDDYRLAEIILKNGLNDTVIDGRDTIFFVYATDLLRAVLKQAKIGTFVGEIPLPMITPPFLQRIKLHTGAENPTDKS